MKYRTKEEIIYKSSSVFNFDDKIDGKRCRRPLVGQRCKMVKCATVHLTTSWALDLENRWQWKGWWSVCEVKTYTNSENKEVDAVSVFNVLIYTGNFVYFVLKLSVIPTSSQLIPDLRMMFEWRNDIGMTGMRMEKCHLFSIIWDSTGWPKWAWNERNWHSKVILVIPK